MRQQQRLIVRRQDAGGDQRGHTVGRFLQRHVDGRRADGLQKPQQH
jgi:hypothetical protein